MQDVVDSFRSSFNALFSVEDSDMDEENWIEDVFRALVFPKELDFSVLGHDVIPEEMTFVRPQLTSFSSRNNSVETIPTSFDHFPHMKSLDLSTNRINRMETTFHFPQLCSLDLSHNSLSELPPDFGSHIPYLEEFIISGNRIKMIPESFRACRKLRFLDASENELHIFPPFSRRAPIEMLNVSKNHISELPRSLFEIHGSPFSSHDDISLMSPGTGDAKISEEGTEERDSVNSASWTGTIEILDLSDNEFTGFIVKGLRDQDWIPSFSRLRCLYLSRNRMIHLPLELCSLKALQFLDVSMNHLFTVPIDFAHMANLKSLELGGNKLLGMGDLVSEGVSPLRDLSLRIATVKRCPVPRHSKELSVDEGSESETPAATMNEETPVYGFASFFVMGSPGIGKSAFIDDMCEIGKDDKERQKRERTPLFFDGKKRKNFHEPGRVVHESGGVRVITQRSQIEDGIFDTQWWDTIGRAEFVYSFSSLFANTWDNTIHLVTWGLDDEYDVVQRSLKIWLHYALTYRFDGEKSAPQDRCIALVGIQKRGHSDAISRCQRVMHFAESFRRQLLVGGETNIPKFVGFFIADLRKSKYVHVENGRSKFDRLSRDAFRECLISSSGSMKSRGGRYSVPIERHQQQQKQQQQHMSYRHDSFSRGIALDESVLSIRGRVPFIHDDIVHYVPLRSYASRLLGFHGAAVPVFCPRRIFQGILGIKDEDLFGPILTLLCESHHVIALHREERFQTQDMSSCYLLRPSWWNDLFSTLFSYTRVAKMRREEETREMQSLEKGRSKKETSCVGVDRASSDEMIESEKDRVEGRRFSRDEESSGTNDEDETDGPNGLSGEDVDHLKRGDEKHHKDESGRDFGCVHPTKRVPVEGMHDIERKAMEMEVEKEVEVEVEVKVKVEVEKEKRKSCVHSIRPKGKWVEYREDGSWMWSAVVRGFLDDEIVFHENRDANCRIASFDPSLIDVMERSMKKRGTLSLEEGVAKGTVPGEILHILLKPFVQTMWGDMGIIHHANPDCFYNTENDDFSSSGCLTSISEDRFMQAKGMVAIVLIMRQLGLCFMHMWSTNQDRKIEMDVLPLDTIFHAEEQHNGDEILIAHAAILQSFVFLPCAFSAVSGIVSPPYRVRPALEKASLRCVSVFSIGFGFVIPFGSVAGWMTRLGEKMATLLNDVQSFWDQNGMNFWSGENSIRVIIQTNGYTPLRTDDLKMQFFISDRQVVPSDESDRSVKLVWKVIQLSIGVLWEQLANREYRSAIASGEDLRDEASSVHFADFVVRFVRTCQNCMHEDVISIPPPIDVVHLIDDHPATGKNLLRCSECQDGNDLVDHI
eukprot:TRINITY_DN45_c0_g3_i1.p1 TRINITY_DN45_c0_g3~~TRINITY_DN45_c0_g3_i1.p1  ORF type:complete len:1390 (+),score=435.52 TRINITY_DN45_c0_g3_i1:188-4171(+)